MTGNSPWIALIGGVRWSLGLGWWGHRWWVAGGRAGGRPSGWCTGGSGRRCLRAEARWRRPGWGLWLRLWLLLGLLRLLGSEREKTDRSIHNHQPHICCSGIQGLALRAAAYKDGPGCRGWAAGSGGSRGSGAALIGGNVEGRSAGLSGDALLQLPETRIQTVTVLQCFLHIHAFICSQQPQVV